MKLAIILLALINSSLCLANIRNNEDDPALSMYELGLSFVHVNYPQYPGSDENESLTLPFPFFFYRGDILRSDENGGIRGRFLNSDRLEINLSFGGAPPASSKDIKAREGMPSLPFILEVGPGLIYKVIKPSQTHNWSLSLNLPIRIPIAFNDIRTDDRGLVFNPLLFGYYNFIPKKFQTFFFVSYRWANAEYNKTYYQVEPNFITSTRGAYQAKSGNVTNSMGFGLNYVITERWSATSALMLQDLSNSANKKSPLFKKDNHSLFFAALSWTLFKSDKKQQQ